MRGGPAKLFFAAGPAGLIFGLLDCCRLQRDPAGCSSRISQLLDVPHRRSHCPGDPNKQTRKAGVSLRKPHGLYGPSGELIQDVERFEECLGPSFAGHGGTCWVDSSSQGEAIAPPHPLSVLQPA